METGELRAALVDGLKSLDAVRQRLLDLVADLDGGDGIQVVGQGHWTRPMVEQLWHEVRHLEGARALFTVAAAHPNGVVTFDQVRAASGLDDRQQRNHHARVSRVATQLFGEPRWPIQNWQGPPPRGGGKAQMHYRMGGTVAEWWRQIVGEDG